MLKMVPIKMATLLVILAAALASCCKKPPEKCFLTFVGNVDKKIRQKERDEFAKSQCTYGRGRFSKKKVAEFFTFFQTDYCAYFSYELEKRCGKDCLDSGCTPK